MNKNNFVVHGCFKLRAFDRKTGKLLWESKLENKYTDEGLDYILEVIFKGGTRYDPLYIGLLGSDATDPHDWKMSNNGSVWTEVTAYDETARQEFIDGSISGHKINNAENQATFNINGSVIVWGAFLTTNNTKGGDTGILLCASNFEEGQKNLDNGAVLKITYEVGAQNPS